MAQSPGLALISGPCDFSRYPTDVGLLVVCFIFLIAFVLMFIFWFGRIKPLDGAVKDFPVFGFLVALVAAFIYYVLYIAMIFVEDCAYLDDAVNGLYVGSFIAWGILGLMNLGIVLIYVLPLVANLIAPVRFVHWILVVILGGIFVPYVVINSLYSLGDYVLDDSISVPPLDVVLNLAAAYDFLLLCVATYCVGVLVCSRLVPRSRKQPLTDWILAAVLCLFLLRLLIVIKTFTWLLPSVVDNEDYSGIPDGAFVAFFALESAASAASFFGILMSKP